MRSNIFSKLIFASLCVILRSRVLRTYVGACYTRGASLSLVRKTDHVRNLSHADGMSIGSNKVSRRKFPHRNALYLSSHPCRSSNSFPPPPPRPLFFSLLFPLFCSSAPPTIEIGQKSNKHFYVIDITSLASQPSMT